MAIYDAYDSGVGQGLAHGIYNCLHFCVINNDKSRHRFSLMKRRANGCTLSVVKEAQADKQKPGIYLGDTAARAADVETAKLPECFAHTHELAVPADRYADKYPEYFALVGGQRIGRHQHEWKVGVTVKKLHLCYASASQTARHRGNTRSENRATRSRGCVDF
jgi:hypothetical protein